MPTEIVKIKKKGALPDINNIKMTADPSARLRPRKLIVEILFEKGWMTLNQIDSVLEEIFKDQQ